MLPFAAGHYGKFCRGEACFIFRLFTVNIELRALYRRGLSAHPLELQNYMHTRRSIPGGSSTCTAPAATCSRHDGCGGPVGSTAGQSRVSVRGFGRSGNRSSVETTQAKHSLPRLAKKVDAWMAGARLVARAL